MNDGMHAGKPQRVLVLQQNGSGETKISGIRRYGEDRFVISTYDIDEPLPPFIDSGTGYLPQAIDADIVLDYLQHPDLSCDLWLLCERKGIPVVAPNKKGGGAWALTPRICCALPRKETLGEYGRRFGAPEFTVRTAGGMIEEILVLRGAPCGATWEAARLTAGMPLEEALAHIGLATQHHCTADPAGWDVMHGTSPVHLAAELHKAALKKALDRL